MYDLLKPGTDISNYWDIHILNNDSIFIDNDNEIKNLNTSCLGFDIYAAENSKEHG